MECRPRAHRRTLNSTQFQFKIRAAQSKRTPAVSLRIFVRPRGLTFALKFRFRAFKPGHQFQAKFEWCSLELCRKLKFAHIHSWPGYNPSCLRPTTNNCTRIQLQMPVTHYLMERSTTFHYDEAALKPNSSLFIQYYANISADNLSRAFALGNRSRSGFVLLPTMKQRRKIPPRIFFSLPIEISSSALIDPRISIKMIASRMSGRASGN